MARFPGLSLRDLCDVAYTLLLEQTERDALAERQVAAVLIAANRIDSKELPSVQTARDRLDAALLEDTAASRKVDAEQASLRRALGLPGG